MKLITEHYDDFEVLTEGKDGKDVKIKGVFMQAETKNRNGRVYPLDVLQKEVKRYTKELVENKRAFGELGHPDGPTVNLDRVSHIIEELYPEGNNIIGKAKILDTPNGKIVKELLNAGAKLGVSSRGMGTLEKKGQTNYVKDDFYLATAGDIVADPSAPKAFVEGIMEGKEWVWDNGILREEEVARIHRVASANKQAEAFEMFLSKL
ncbi:MAG: primosomal protein [bacterium TMED46]|nr:MAG: primosomal protein [bacterium TMED46]|tara:strand:+ start:207 stop:827 length:621 start_codon:yes stop_codon:yes gene_type:complete